MIKYYNNFTCNFVLIFTEILKNFSTILKIIFRKPSHCEHSGETKYLWYGQASLKLIILSTVPFYILLIPLWKREFRFRDPHLKFWVEKLTEKMAKQRKRDNNSTGGSDGKESACNGGDLSSIPGWGRFPGEGNGNPLQYSGLESSMDRGACQVMVHGVTKSQIQLTIK